jgi:hypothetical protein
MIQEALKVLIGNYGEFCRIAADITFAKTDLKHLDWYNKYPVGITLTMVTFPEGFVKKSPEAAMVQCMLMKIASEEGWTQDFWDVTHEERQEYLTNGELLYIDCVKYAQERLCPVTSEHMCNEIKWYAGKNGIPEGSYEEVLSIVRSGENIDIGGQRSCDHTYISVAGDTILLSEMGIWD